MSADPPFSDEHETLRDSVRRFVAKELRPHASEWERARCGSGGRAADVGAHVGIATPPLRKFGTEEQKRRYLAPAIAGEKTYTTNGVRAGFYVTAVKTTAQGGHHGLSIATRGWSRSGAAPTRS